MFRYSIVREDQDRASLAKIASQMIAHDLGLTPVPDVYFFEEDSRGLVYDERCLAGWCTKDRQHGQHVGIRMGLTAQATFEILCHEMRHAYQQRRGWGDRSEIARERDARIYASSWPLFPRSISFRQLIESLGNAIVGALEDRDIRWRSDAHDTAGRVRVICNLCEPGFCYHQPRK
jgi:hypothetical protein